MIGSVNYEVDILFRFAYVDSKNPISGIIYGASD